jgi:hypothetical protein
LINTTTGETKMPKEDHLQDIYKRIQDKTEADKTAKETETKETEDKK